MQKKLLKGEKRRVAGVFAFEQRGSIYSLQNTLVANRMAGDVRTCGLLHPTRGSRDRESVKPGIDQNDKNKIKYDRPWSGSHSHAWRWRGKTCGHDYVINTSQNT